MRKVFLLLIMLLGSCAIPRPPSGGPPDRIPPRLVSSDPAAGATHVRTNRIRLTFSEYIDPTTFRQALSIWPEPETPPRIRWKGKTAELVFDQPLRTNTTYLIVLDTQLKDWHGVPLSAPITLAFSTGTSIHEARIQGEVRLSWSDLPAQAFDVLAYRHPPRDTQTPPDYRTQTDPQGRFELAYLPDTTFFVVALEDRNRNHRPDPTEAFAPPPVIAIPALRTPEKVYRWYVTRLDTLPPELRLVRARSNQHIELRFSEPVRLLSLRPEQWHLTTSGGQPLQLHALFQSQTPSPLVYVLTEPLPLDSLTLFPTAIADTAGNLLPETQRTFFPRSEPDTAHIRFLGFLPIHPLTHEGQRFVLSPYVRPGVRFSLPPDTTQLTSTLHVRDALGQPIDYRYESPDGLSFYLHFASPPSSPFEITLDGRLIGRDTLFTQTYRYLRDDELGSLIVPIRYSEGTPVVATLLALDAGRLPEPLSHPVSRKKEITFSHLPEGRYRIRVFLDRSENRRWDGGTILPYEPPERLIWIPDTLRVRPRWEIVLDTLELNDLP